MRFFVQRLALFALVAFVADVSARAQAIRTEVPQTQMTVRQARKALRESFADRILPATEVKIDRHQLSWVEVTQPKPNVKSVTTHIYVFAKVHDLTVKSQKKYFHHESAAAMFVDAVLALKAAESAPDTEETDFAAFSSNAKVWLQSSAKPAMPDEILTYKVLAEDAFKQKDYLAALDYYGDALDRFSMWPEGHYNAALLAAETGDYVLAAHHMRRYLCLAPGAKDAAAAKEKFLLWQYKAKQ